MSLLAQLSTDDTIKQKQYNVGNSPLESGCYPLTVQTAYITTSDGGALGLVCAFKTDGGRDFKQTLWMTSGTAKGGKNFYTDKNGDKQYLPGFLMANSLAQLATGKEISALDTETKVVKQYNKDAGKEMPVQVNMVMDLLGTQVIAGILKQTVDKTAKDSDGIYKPTGETRDENEIDKLFRAKDSLTVAEIRNGDTEAKYIETWKTKWTGKTKMKAKGATANAGTPGAPKAAAKKPVSLFE
jgi:hypothetical protein